jgi:putative tryptophan/tyrosine transport system substrate-binding protein
MTRREFLAGLGGAAARPLVARAQQPPMPLVGILGSGSPDAFAPDVAAFLQGLKETGYIEGQNVAIESRWADGQYDRLPALATDLVRRPLAAILASGGTIPTRAAKAATNSIPIVFTTTADPVASGLVASFNRPGGNITGVSFLSVELGPKQLGLLRELVPTVTTVALLVNTNNPSADGEVRNAQIAMRALGVRVRVLTASTERDIDHAFASLAQQRADALLVHNDPFFLGLRAQLLLLTTRHAIPTIYAWRDFVAAGGLMSYGAKSTDAYRQAGIYVGRILKGEKAADLPVVQPTKFELAINLTTAKALGLSIPPGLLAIADEVIE